MMVLVLKVITVEYTKMLGRLLQGCKSSEKNHFRKKVSTEVAILRDKKKINSAMSSYTAHVTAQMPLIQSPA